MTRLELITRARYRPLLVTTQTLYPKWSQLLHGVRVAERRTLIVVLPPESPQTRECLLAVGQRFEQRGGTVRVIEANAGVEKYFAVRQRLTEGRR
jgi:fructoselysine-6-P-deglycase FrlB-like protein